MVPWSGSIKPAMNRVHTTWAGILRHYWTGPRPISFIWSGKVILGLGFASPNITLPDQMNMILVLVLSNKCMVSNSSAVSLFLFNPSSQTVHLFLQRASPNAPARQPNYINKMSANMAAVISTEIFLKLGEQL